MNEGLIILNQTGDNHRAYVRNGKTVSVSLGLSGGVKPNSYEFTYGEFRAALESAIYEKSMREGNPIGSQRQGESK